MFIRFVPKPPKLQQFCTGDPEIHRLKNLLVHGHVYKEDCITPIPHVRMEIWQADHEGNYKMSADCRGHFKTDKHGYYEITTIHPGKYSVDTRYSNPLYTRDHEQEDFSNDEFQDLPCKTVVVSVVLENNMVQ
jgi:protocatechuate 3,4-dioxygenase beta subunit